MVARYHKAWKEGQEPLKHAYRLSMESADTQFGLISPVLSILNLLVAGGPIAGSAQAMKSVYQVLYQKNQDILMRILRPFFQYTLNILGTNPKVNPIDLTGAIMNLEEDVKFAEITKNHKIMFCILLCRADMAYTLHEFFAAKDYINQIHDLAPPSLLEEELIISSLLVHFRFLDAMTAIALLWEGQYNEEEGIQLMEQIQSSLDKLHELAQYCPDNIAQKVWMIEGEMMAFEATALGDMAAAQRVFQQAIDHCQKHGLIKEQCLAMERLGLALRVREKEDDALDMLEDACGLYRQYGALIKVSYAKRVLLYFMLFGF